MDPIELVIHAYQYASFLFDPSSKFSIVNDTLLFYQIHMKNTLVSANTRGNILENDLYNELLNNQNYYSLFYLDYYLELFRTKGIVPTFAELEEDVNIRAYTFYNTSYRLYIKILSV
jgi:hypothetical protein